MLIFKFGGASVKDADAVRNVVAILRLFPDEKIVAVVSAMGKTTNALEKLTDAYFSNNGNTEECFAEMKKYHDGIIEELFPQKNHPFHSEIHDMFLELHSLIEGKPQYDYDKEYDQIVSCGELIATKIVSVYLAEAGIKNSWLDARDLIRTDETWREGKVNWKETERLVRKKVSGEKNSVIITQGFLGGTAENFSTTLGREGSDYTAAILAYCLNAESVTIWKDVHGVLNADPKWFDDTRLIPQLSYQDAIELSYYGATVIHPKTIKPLQNKKIPLHVKSFVRPMEKGTVIGDVHEHLPVPCFIFKVNQVLLSISPKDFSFIVEENMSEIYRIFSEQGVRINMMENSAISFSVCVDNDERRLQPLMEALRKKFRVLYNYGAELVTIRYYDQPTIERVTIGKQVLLEVKSRYTCQMVMKDL